MSLVLVRGLPGSGKSTFAKALASVGFRHYEADMWFERDGVYTFDPAKLKEAHAWCLSQSHRAIERGENVVVSNTFTRLWEMQPYIDAAQASFCPVHVVVMTGKWGNVHGVPDDVIERMRSRWEAA